MENGKGFPGSDDVWGEFGLLEGVLAPPTLDLIVKYSIPHWLDFEC
jgi:hypothetical protein